jgi:hypothetical protein
MRNTIIKLYSFIIILLLVGLLYYTTIPRKDGFSEKKPQKIAIIFSGRIKGYANVLPKLQKLIDMYNPVIFCSVNESVFTDEIEQFSKDLEVPKSQINVELTLLPSWSEKCNLMNPVLNVYSMFYHQNKAFTLVEEYQKRKKMAFDCILYYRADMNSTDTLELKMPLNNTVYLPNDRGYGGFNDRMAYGDFHTMKIYCSLIYSFEGLCISNEQINSESILKTYLINNEINVVGVPYNTDLHETRNFKHAMGILDK